MREILFRGKRLDNGEWIKGWYEPEVDVGSCSYHCGVSIACKNSEGWLDDYEVDPATVGQYTGRKDKNGKRVFEGDILRLFAIWVDGTVGPVDVPVTVQFCENDQCYVLTTKQGSYYDDFGNYGRPEYYEVIGNIHDNPELLEVEK